MKHVLFCNNIDYVNTLQWFQEKEPCHYLVFDYARKHADFTTCLAQRTHCELVPAHILDEVREAFQNDFIKFLGMLNKKNHSRLWWALHISNKNPISTPLCTEVFQLLSVYHAMQSSQIKRLIVVTNNRILVRQYKTSCALEGVTIKQAIKSFPSLKSFLLSYTPAGVIFAFLRMVWCMFYARLTCPNTINKNKMCTAVISLLTRNSFKKDGGYNDTYFGIFMNYVRTHAEQVVSIVILRPRCYRSLLKRAFNKSSNACIIPIDYFLTLRDLIICLFVSFKKYCRPIAVKGDLTIRGVGCALLLKKSIRYDYVTPYYFDNIRIYYAFRNLAKKATIERCYYPFENRPFEKMVLCAFREESTLTKLIGYQHASISLRHTNFLLEETESNITPLPDTIITMGDITKEILQTQGHFPAQLCHVGCALRQTPFSGIPKNKPEKITNVLVVLATNIDEYVKVLLMLNDAFMNGCPYTVWVRPHPVFPLEDALAITGKLSFTFHKANQESMDQCFVWSDAVIYVHSTLGIEAIMRGIPVINLAIDNPLNPDPLFNFNDFKWVVKDPLLLHETIQHIDSLSKDDYKQRQQCAFTYARNYFTDITDEALARFL